MDKELLIKLIDLFSNEKQTETEFKPFLNEWVIIRTYSAGVWFGKLTDKSGNEVILKDARRMWKWCAKQSISLSACAKYGINKERSKIVAPVDKVWIEAIEILPCTDQAILLIKEAPYVEAE